MTTTNQLHDFFPILNFVLFSISICVRAALPVPDNYLIDCGATANTTSADGRKWQGDANSQFAVSGNGEQILASTNHSSGLSTASDTAVLYATGRIFTSRSNYTIPVTPGRHWVRLYFYPFAYQNFDPVSATFSVMANEITLLSSINLLAELRNLKRSYLYKEYSLYINSNKLVIQFAPARGSFAVINGLEVVSMQADAVFVGNGSADAIETVYRLNVGGQTISPVYDSGLTRIWAVDYKYVLDAAVTSTTLQYPPSRITYSPNISSYVAPKTVYSTARVMADAQTAEQSFNISWVLPIDVNFTHYIRLHLCELFYNQINERVFNVYIQNQTARAVLDLIGLGLKQNQSTYIDFVAPRPIAGVDLLFIQVGPTQNSGTQLNNAILNGIEVFKVNDSTGSLAGSARVDNSAANIAGKPSSSPGGTNTRSKKLKWVTIGVSLVGAAALATILGACCCCCQKNRKMKVFPPPSPSWCNFFVPAKNDHAKSKLNGVSEPVQESVSTSIHLNSISVPSSPAINQPCRLFTFQGIQAATNNFDEALLIGEGGFGKVYRGQFEGAIIPVAIKRANNRSEQGAREFQNEIEVLSKLRHRHLVSLIGFCDENGEMLLVYEYMANGPLRNHLYGYDNFPLSWRQRLEICIGAARGLHYLHTGITQGIIHRDVKSTNILLDERYVAKIADFGICKTGPPLDKSHVSTRVKGSFGYLDPEYFRTQQLTEKSDVYAFGVVLLEVICARPVINPSPTKEAVNIVEWALQWHTRGMPEKIVDSRLHAEAYSSESLGKVLQTSRRCLQEKGRNRPTMGDVLWHLEYALQLQLENGRMER